MMIRQFETHDFDELFKFVSEKSVKKDEQIKKKNDPMFKINQENYQQCSTFMFQPFPKHRFSFIKNQTHGFQCFF